MDEERDQVAFISLRHAKVKEQLMSQLDSSEQAMRTLQSALDEERARTQGIVTMGLGYQLGNNNNL